MRDIQNYHCYKTESKRHLFMPVDNETQRMFEAHGCTFTVMRCINCGFTLDRNSKLPTQPDDHE